MSPGAWECIEGTKGGTGEGAGAETWRSGEVMEVSWGQEEPAVTAAGDLSPST